MKFSKKEKELLDLIAQQLADIVYDEMQAKKWEKSQEIRRVARRRCRYDEEIDPSYQEEVII